MLCSPLHHLTTNSEASCEDAARWSNWPGELSIAKKAYFSRSALTQLHPKQYQSLAQRRCVFRAQTSLCQIKRHREPWTIRRIIAKFSTEDYALILYKRWFHTKNRLFLNENTFIHFISFIYFYLKIVVKTKYSICKGYFNPWFL